MFLKNRLLYIYLLLSFSILIANARITGKVSDASSNEPLIGVNVLLVEKTEGQEAVTDYGASTDIDGEYLIENVPPGDYLVRAMYIGYKNNNSPLLVESGDDNNKYVVDISLDISEIALEETKVAATVERKEKVTEAPATIETVSSKEIEQASTSNLGSYLQGLKGVDFTASGVNNYSLSIRGFNSSFSTRLLMLTDGRPANVPSLRVVNFSTVPVTADDVEKIEVVLGPATALYGANAHSGVINIVSKSPALSPGLTASYSGTFDERKLQKFNARYAYKVNDKLSFKISGSHFQAQDWPFISELEYKAHRNPWVGFPGRKIDRRDNNASQTSFSGGLTPAKAWNLRWVQTDSSGIQVNVGNVPQGLNGWINADAADGLYYIMLGDGEPNHGDKDGDGVAGEDWFNGHDDDGDGLIDEDYWTADGIDNAEPFNDLNGDGIFNFIDENGNGIHDGPEPFFDLNGNGVWDEGEWYVDLQNTGEGEPYYTSGYQSGEIAQETWDDWDSDGSYDDYNGIIDEYIDNENDEWIDGVDNNNNGLIDDASERYTTGNEPSQWALSIDGGTLVASGRYNKYLMDGSLNPWYVENASDADLRGTYRYNKEKFRLEFDVYEWDFGDDGIPGDFHYDMHGDGVFHRGEPGTSGADGFYFEDYGLDGFKYYPELDEGQGHQAVWENISGDLVYVTDINGDPIWIDGPDEGEGDGIWQPGDTWNDVNFNWQVEQGEEGWMFNDNFNYIQHIIGVDDGGMAGVIDDCYPGFWGTNPWTGEEGWNFLSYGTNIDDTQMEIDQNGNVLNCYGICPGEESQYYTADCQTDLSLYINFETNEDPSTWTYAQNQDFTYNEIEVSQNILYDVWPPPDFVYGAGDIALDCGQDGYCWDFDAEDQNAPQHATDIWGNYVYETNENGESVPVTIQAPDFGEGDGFNVADNGDYDGFYDTSDGKWNVRPEPFIDTNENGIWDVGEEFTDEDGNGYYTQGDWHPNLDKVNDTNGDGVPDFPDYQVVNDKIEFRLDYDPSDDLNFSFQTGYAYSKTQQVTGVGRYLADGWKSNYYQLKARYKDWFMQGYLNTNDAGQTRGYNRGDMILDESINYGFQIQHSFELPKFSTEIIWGLDYMKTLPFTDGTVLNDGPNGFDDDEDKYSYMYDNIDQDGDGVIYADWDEIYYGIDEDDEFSQNIFSNEFGFYFQSKTIKEKLYGNNFITKMLRGRWELIASARLDYHDQLKEEGLLFGPKFGLKFNPMKDGVINPMTTFRMGYGRAYNTPTITSLYTNLIFGTWGENFTMILRGNRDGTPYARADNSANNELGQWGYPVNLVDPFFYEMNSDGSYAMNDDGSYHTINIASGGLNDCTFDPNNPCDPYVERVQGAPLFLNMFDGQYPSDYIPLDTLNHIIFIPSAYDDGVDYTPLESVNLTDIDPLTSESMRTLEFGVSTFLSKKTLLTSEVYFTRYDNFFSPATFITPLVKDRYTGDVIGLVSSSLDHTYAPYGTAWDGMDNDNDWSGLGYYVSHEDIQCTNGNTYPCGQNSDNWEYYIDYENLQDQISGDELQDWSVIFGWDDDKDENGNPQDPGEWGFVDRLYLTDEGYYIYTVTQPGDIWNSATGSISNPILPASWDEIDGRWMFVGVDEYSTLQEIGHMEAEIIDSSSGRLGFPDKLPIITLSSLNYGQVYHSGLDMGITHFFTERFMVDFNFTLFNSTDYYNELTKRFDPINSPKFKFNLALSLDTKLGTFLCKLRHVDKFDWADGTWAGTIGPYNIVDMHYNYEITNNLKFGVTAMNLFDDRHRELVGGAKMGRQVIVRLTTTF